VKLGIFFDLRNPAQWRRPWAEVYGRALEQIEEAERLGIASVWATEHHFFDDGYLPQPMTFIAAVAARTKRVRIGTSVMLAGLRPAVDIAEQAAIVDLISDGRLEVGLGAGYRRPEFAAYGADIKQRFPLLEDRIVEVRRLWDEGGVTPPPAQQRVPLWVGGQGPRAARIAARSGEGLMSLQPQLVEPYRAALVKAGRDPSSARMAGTVNMVVADDPEAAWPRIKPHLAHQWSSYQRYGAEGGGVDATPDSLDRTAAAEADPEQLRSAGPVMASPSFDVVTPAEAAARLRAWLDPMPAEHGYLWASIAGMPDDIVNRHIELLATEVAPAVADVGTFEAPGAGGDD
jgi:alkanesulfonate monooxygenase SsuD/methylene tetrahydromethanopterin reductase-like flavin-dependent oxidoreductase (luciferase family)